MFICASLSSALDMFSISFLDFCLEESVSIFVPFAKHTKVVLVL